MFRAEKYDPAAWAALFKNSGARYVVLTSSHHDGYCLWDAPDSGEVVWNDRWGKKTRGKHGAFYTTEYGKHGKEGGAHPWEENRGIGGSYGYNTWYEDKLEKYPSSQELLDVFVDTISRGGNFLLNVGPRSDGTIMDLFQQRLSDIGRFLKTNGEAVYGSRLAHKSEEKVKIKYTRSGDGRFHYAFVKGRPGDALSPPGIHLREGEEVVLLADPEKRPLSWTQDDKGLTISGINRVSQHGEFYWVFRLPGGLS